MEDALLEELRDVKLENEALKRDLNRTNQLPGNNRSRHDVRDETRKLQNRSSDVKPAQKNVSFTEGNAALEPEEIVDRQRTLSAHDDNNDNDPERHNRLVGASTGYYVYSTTNGSSHKENSLNLAPSTNSGKINNVIDRNTGHRQLVSSEIPSGEPFDVIDPSVNSTSGSIQIGHKERVTKTNSADINDTVHSLDNHGHNAGENGKIVRHSPSRRKNDHMPSYSLVPRSFKRCNEGNDSVFEDALTFAEWTPTITTSKRRDVSRYVQETMEKTLTLSPRSPMPVNDAKIKPNYSYDISVPIGISSVPDKVVYKANEQPGNDRDRKQAGIVDLSKYISGVNSSAMRSDQHESDSDEEFSECITDSVDLTEVDPVSCNRANCQKNVERLHSLRDELKSAQSLFQHVFHHNNSKLQTKEKHIKELKRQLSCEQKRCNELTTYIDAMRSSNVEETSSSYQVHRKTRKSPSFDRPESLVVDDLISQLYTLRQRTASMSEEARKEHESKARMKSSYDEIERKLVDSKDRAIKLESQLKASEGNLDEAIKVNEELQRQLEQCAGKIVESKKRTRGSRKAPPKPDPLTLTVNDRPIDLPDSWNCRYCTFTNHPRRTVCELCGLLKSPSGPERLHATSEMDYPNRKLNPIKNSYRRDVIEKSKSESDTVDALGLFVENTRYRLIPRNPQTTKPIDTILDSTIENSESF